MLRENNNVWLHYRENIISSDRRTGKFLYSYLTFSAMNRTYLPFLEVLDLQKYKVIKNKSKINKVLRFKTEEPFIFVVGKN